MKNTSAGNTKFLTIGGGIIVVLALLLVGMYGKNLKTQVGFSGLPSGIMESSSEDNTEDCISRDDWDEANRKWSEVNAEINQLLTVQIANITYSIASIQTEISMVEARQRNGENVEGLLADLRRTLADKQDRLVDLQEELLVKVQELRMWESLKAKRICDSSAAPSSYVAPRQTSSGLPMR